MCNFDDQTESDIQLTLLIRKTRQNLLTFNKIMTQILSHFNFPGGRVVLLCHASLLPPPSEGWRGGLSVYRLLSHTGFQRNEEYFRPILSTILALIQQRRGNVFVWVNGAYVCVSYVLLFCFVSRFSFVFFER